MSRREDGDWGVSLVSNILATPEDLSLSHRTHTKREKEKDVDMCL